MIPVESKVAIVTGGSSGIGRAAALALAEHGFRLVIVGTNLERINGTLQALAAITVNQDEPPHLGLALNVSQEADMQEMARQTMEHFGRIDLLLACAALGKKPGSSRAVPHPTAALPLEEWNEILDINLTGVFLSNRAVLPVMMAQGAGHIINISTSTGPHGLRGTPYAPAYCASKFGVVGLSESLAEEVGDYGIRVQVIFPGHVETPMTAQTRLVALYGETMSAENVAKTIVYFVQQANDAIAVHPCLIPFKSS